jgi:hypothetical protein
MGATEKQTQATQYFGYITISHHSSYFTHTVRFAHARFARVSLPLFSRSALASLASLARIARSLRSLTLPPTGGKSRHHPDSAQAAKAAIPPPIRGVRF